MIAPSDLGLLNRAATDQKTVAERKWIAGLKPAKEQKPCDEGLFSDDHCQMDLLTLANRA
jgi:hypothetical protein